MALDILSPASAAAASQSEQPPAQMMALVFHGPGLRAWESRPRPVLRAVGDAVVRITTSTICGTDLHILKGDVPSVTPGRVLGHEGVGVIESIGAAVTSLAVGDRVLVSCITACGTCDTCLRGMRSHCRTGGWILGNTIDGTQAEFVRIPHAETSLYKVPADADAEALVMLSDIFPTAYECGVVNGRVSPGDTVAIIGAGPIGLAALLTARLLSPMSVFVIDRDSHRLDVATSLGATAVVNSGTSDVVAAVLALTGGAGVDVAIEASSPTAAPPPSAAPGSSVPNWPRAAPAETATSANAPATPPSGWTTPFVHSCPRPRSPRQYAPDPANQTDRRGSAGPAHWPTPQCHPDT